MKKDLHPKYAPTKIKCSCGAEFEVGSTSDNIKVEICSQCHPLYTGNKKLVDTAGRVDRFMAKVKKGEELQKKASKKSSDASVGVPTDNVGKIEKKPIAEKLAELKEK